MVNVTGRLFLSSFGSSSEVTNLSQNAAAILPARSFSAKCSRCGLRNFPDANLCARCDADLSRPSSGPKVTSRKSDNSGERRQTHVRRGLICAGVLAILFALGLLYFRQAPEATPEAISSIPVATPENSEPAPAAPDPAQQDAESQQAANQVLAGLKHLQGATQTSITYDEYDQMLSQLKSDLNNTLPSFVRHNPSDESFRHEVDAAVRDSTAAGNWWKTTIRNSSVFDDADRFERLQVEWNSAQTHLDNAELALLQR